jgi:hypothetical protein
MRIKLSFFAGVLFAAAVGAVEAGPVELESKEMAPPPTITDNDQWHFNIGSPGWIAFLSGTVGLRGVDSNVNLPFDEILKHVEFVMSVSADVRKGRFGFYSDFLEMDLSDAVYRERALSKANIKLSQYLFDGELYYRILECPRGYLDLRAGARYYDLYSSLKFFGNSRLIDEAAANFVTAANEDLRGLLERILQGAENGGGSPLPIPPLGVEEKKKIIHLIRAARMDPMTAQAKISKILNRELNRTLSLTERWADPYIGIGGQYNLTKAFYLTGKVDVGGFDVGSDISTQGSAALGCNITRRIYSEVGFRYLYVNYEDDSNRFLWRTWTYGPQITTGISF